MVNLLAIWHAQGLPAILREAWQRGIVLAGLSAGSMCWFEYGVTTSVGQPRSRGPRLPARLELRPLRRRARAAPGVPDAVASGAIPGGWGADDGAALLFRGAAWPRSSPRGRTRAPTGSGPPHGRERRRGPDRTAPVPPRPTREAMETELAIGELRGLHAARRGRRLD